MAHYNIVLLTYLRTCTDVSVARHAERHGISSPGAGQAVTTTVEQRPGSHQKHIGISTTSVCLSVCLSVGVHLHMQFWTEIIFREKGYHIFVSASSKGEKRNNVTGCDVCPSVCLSVIGMHKMR